MMPRQLPRSPPAPRSAWLLPVLAIMLVAGPAGAEAPVSLVAPGATSRRCWRLRGASVPSLRRARSIPKPRRRGSRSPAPLPIRRCASRPTRSTAPAGRARIRRSSPSSRNFLAVGQAGPSARPGRRRSRSDPGRYARDRGRARREGKGRLRPVLPGRSGDPHDRGFAPRRA